ncbi:hypothetical protein EDB83DRAFT_2393903 [Lactarius deliciosus]|nr:hypothetical protein EDB83DRAFT_2393903 [Lactarius deliciosus]
MSYDSTSMLADPGSGDDIPDTGKVDSDGSDFVASGGTRTAIRAARGSAVRVASGASATAYAVGGTPAPSATAGASRTELDQSYLGLIPPARFIIAEPFVPTKHVDLMEHATACLSSTPTHCEDARVQVVT